MGLHLSIDDFGTGYSSLSALQQFPIGTLKIDQSFVRDAATNADDATIVRTIIDMGTEPRGWRWSPKASRPKSSSISCAAAAATTRRAGCSATPMSADEFLALLLAQQSGRGKVAQLFA